MKRKKFFVLAGTAMAGLMSLKFFPFSVAAKDRKPDASKVTVTINPLAVQRKSGGKNNG